jgi:orotidine-5'-phosphate decarboxylase|tara:strand:+ start:2354 stop:3001 length:648 start_codon:yes stop_codon:yes gene_type:complete
MRLKKKSRLILAMDLKDEKRSLEVCNNVKDYIDAIKVGYPLILSNGLDILTKIKKFGKPIIADFKVADIPWTSEKICKLATTNGADYVIIQGFLGEDVIKTCSKVAKIFVVAEMTHPGAKDFMQRNSLEISGIAKKYAYGIVAPATRPESIKKIRKIVGDMIIISPGIKVQGGKVGSALKAGADFEIIGRGIYDDKNPQSAAKIFYNKIEENFKR